MKTHQKIDKDFVKEYFELITKEPKIDDSRLSSNATTLKQSISSLQAKIKRKEEMLASLAKESSLSLKRDREPSFSEKASFVLSELISDVQKIGKFLSQYTNTSIDSRKGSLTFLIIAGVILLRFLLFNKFFVVISIMTGAIYTGNKLTVLKKRYKNKPKEKNVDTIEKVKEEIEVLRQEVKTKEIELKTLGNFPRDRKNPYLETLESQVKELLSDDLWYLLSEAKREFGIYNSDEQIHTNSNLEPIDKKPIITLIGIPSKDKIERAVSQNVAINSDKFYDVVGLDGKRKYSIYEFAVIFLYSDCLCGYKCYWNFFKGVEIGGKSYKFPYNRIDTIKIKEKSSEINEFDFFSLEESKNLEKTRQQTLSISTIDGNTVEFTMNNNSQEIIDSQSNRYISNPDKALQLIHSVLRENG